MHVIILGGGGSRSAPPPNEALDKALGCEKLLFRERVLEASKFIVDSNYLLWTWERG